MIVNKGNPQWMGCHKLGSDYFFSFESIESEATLLIFDEIGENEVFALTMDISYKSGAVFSCCLSGQDLDRCLYCYQVNQHFVVDPYAKSVSGCSEFGVISDHERFLSRIVLEPFDWQEDEFLQIAYHDSIFYQLNVRGFTNSSSSCVSNKGTFSGIVEKIPYLKELGITALILMPCYEFDEVHRFPQFEESSFQPNHRILKGDSTSRASVPVNLWGYTKGFHFVPKAAFAASDFSDPCSEFKYMVKALHEAHIEVILQQCFHDESPMLITDCLRYWVEEYHVDGFHLFADWPSIQMICRDPFLAKTKIITDSWDTAFHYQNMAVFHHGFSPTARKLLRGEENQLSDFLAQIRLHSDNRAVVNYITDHNGFTLADLVSFDRKHNEPNGERNCDGENFNFSWNCGVEGKTKKKNVVPLRLKQMKNAWMMLLLTQGIPCILAGDEFANSQEGNNNAYCQDNETGWVNWNYHHNEMAADLLSFVKDLIHVRKSYPVLHLKMALTGSDYLSCGYPDFSCHGSSAWYHALDPFDRHIGLMYCNRYAYPYTQVIADKDANVDLLYTAYNMDKETHDLALPKPPAGFVWKIILSSGESHKDNVIDNQRFLHIQSRTIAVLSTVSKGENEI